MQAYTKTLLSGTVNPTYDSLNVQSTDVRITASRWDYALLPIWILTYTDKRGKVYTFAINGSTGKIYGELPVSYPKLAILVAAVAAPATAILSMIGGMLF